MALVAGGLVMLRIAVSAFNGFLWSLVLCYVFRPTEVWQYVLIVLGAAIIAQVVAFIDVFID